VGDRSFEPKGDALPGQRQPGADDVVAEADVAGRVHGPVDLDDVPGHWRQRRRPGGLRSGCRKAGQVAGIQPGRQGLDPVAGEQDVDLAEAGPDPGCAPGHRPAEPDLLSRDPEVARRRDQPVQLHGLRLPGVAAGVGRGAPPRHQARGCSPAAGSCGGLVSSAGTRRPIASAAAVNRSAGNAMFSDWCGRLVL
jgi:hypothetical protein